MAAGEAARCHVKDGLREGREEGRETAAGLGKTGRDSRRGTWHSRVVSDPASPITQTSDTSSSATRNKAALFIVFVSAVKTVFFKKQGWGIGPPQTSRSFCQSSFPSGPAAGKGGAPELWQSPGVLGEPGRRSVPGGPELGSSVNIWSLGGWAASEGKPTFIQAAFCVLAQMVPRPLVSAGVKLPRPWGGDGCL